MNLLLVIFLIIVAIIILVIFIFVIYMYLNYFRPLRPKEDGFEYVYVMKNGQVRELDESEIEYLNEEFHPNDGNRPYIKYNYTDKTPDGKLNGYIARRRLHKNIKILKN